MMQPGISTACLYPMETEEALELLGGVGTGAVELFANTWSEMEPGNCRELRRRADSLGMRILSLHPFTSGWEPMLFFTDYPRRFREGREFYRGIYRAAAILGANVVVFHGGALGLEMELEEYARRFSLLAQDAREEGVELCHENVIRCRGRNASFFAGLSQLLPGAGYVLDVKQAVRAKEDPMDFVKAMGGGLRHIHISDHRGELDCLPPGEGVFNIRQFLEASGKAGFDGGVVVELYRENFGEIVELIGGFQHLSQIINLVQKSD